MEFGSCDFFKDKYNEVGSRPLQFKSDKFRKLSSENSEFLVSPFSVKEVKDAVWSCGGDKASGPDGFSFAFFKRFGNILGPDFFAAVKNFEVDPILKNGCNDSFIALVPKLKDPLGLGDYRPIHLMGSIGKVISKCLANRLKLVIDTVISPEQTAYVKARKIVDGPLIVNELISWAKYYKKRFFCSKLTLRWLSII